jgi:hypothetical protein
LRGALARKLIDEAKKRRRKPVELLADIVSCVLNDNLINAVIDYE